MSTVEYRDIAGFPGYRVGDDGSVWSCWQYNGHQPRVMRLPWRPIKAQPDGDGYLGLNLFRDGRAHRRKVHLLALEAFAGPRPEAMEGCHNDGNNQNCNLSNLRWDTKEANQGDRLRHGTHCRGEKSPKAILTTDKVHAIRRMIREGRMRKDIAADMGVAPSTIHAIRVGRLWGWLPREQEA